MGIYLMIEYKLWFSERGIPLVYCGPAPKDVPVLTVENYCKWYTLYLIKPNGIVEAYYPNKKLEKECYEKFGFYNGDHNYQPSAVQYIADKEEFILHEEAIEMIIGRYEMEIKGNYQ